MTKQIKVLNKFNGNICFVGATDTGDIIFECDRQANLVYDTSTKLIYDVDFLTPESYFAVFGDSWLGIFTGGVLIENWLDTGVNSIYSISISTNGDYYLLNSQNDQLVKYNGGVIWTFDLPINEIGEIREIEYRESDGVVVCNGDDSICIVRDDATQGTLLNILNIDGAGRLSVIWASESKSISGYIRARQVTGRELDQSSSSSSSSSLL